MFANESLSNRSQSKVKDGRYGSLHHRIPYRLLGRRSMGTKRLVLSSKVFLSAIPTHNCDVVLTFPANTEDSTLMWLLARLKSRKPALTVSVRHHSHSGIYGFYLTADYDSLLQGAEELAILKPLKTEYGGGMKEFVFEDQDCFAGVEDEETFLTSQERQSIVLQFLNDLRATGDDALNGVQFVESQPIVPLLKTNKIVSQVFPLHNSNDLKELRQTWVQALFSPQPLDLVCRYFGVKIALYFAYLGHYTTWLIIPAVFGMLIFLLQGTDQLMEDVCFLCFAFFNVIWASLYLKFWSRSSTGFSYRMGTLEKKDDLLKDPRPLFKGELTKSPVTGHLEPTYPGWKRSLFFYTITSPVMGLCLLVVFITMLLCFELQEWVNELIASADLPYIFSFGPKILLAVVVSIMDEIYKQIAVWLTHKENYRLDESFETNLVIKLVSFQFVNSFLSLFYIGFYLGDMDRLRDQLAALLITRQVLGNIKETLMPYLVWKAKLYSFGYRIATRMSPASVEKEVRKMTTKRKRSIAAASLNKEKKKKTAVDGKCSDEESSTVTTEEEEEGEGIPSLTQAEVESAMKKYEDTVDDFLEMCIQFGYITLFSSAFPLAALCALINNVIEIRSDAFKICLTYQRPFGKRVENIGIWQDVLQFMGILAVIVNCVLMWTTGLLSRLWPGLTPTKAIVVLVIIEHLTIALKLAIEKAIPDVPQTISTEMAKLEYQRREALKQLESQAAPLQTASQLPPSSPGGYRRRVTADGSSRESPSLSPSVNQSVITPSSFPSRPSDISLSSSTKNESSQSILPPPNAPKPEVPPRTSILQKESCSSKPQISSCLSSSSSSSSTHADIAEKVASAAIHPVLENLEKESTNITPTVGIGSYPNPRVQLRPQVKPVMSEDKEMEAVGRRYFRRRLDLQERRGVSDPVSGAVTMALNLHQDQDVGKRSYGQKEDGSTSVRNPYGVHAAKQVAGDSLESNKERRHDLLRRSLQNIAQREELRRTSSLKHTKRASERTLGDSSDQASYPPPTLLTSNIRLNPLSRFISARFKAGTYGSHILSGRQRSLSSENINEPSFSWRDRHSWQAEGASSVGSRQVKTDMMAKEPTLSSKSKLAAPRSEPESEISINDKPERSAVLSKPPSGLQDSKSQTQAENKKPGPEASMKPPTHDATPVSSSNPEALRAVRGAASQPLSISKKNLNTK